MFKELTHSVFLFTFFLTTQATKFRSTPVFLIDSENVMGLLTKPVNPFVTTAQSTFKHLVATASHRAATVIIFSEDQLTTEDLSLKDNLGTPFYHLRQGILEKKVKYFPAVERPFHVLISQLEPSMNHSYHLSDANANLKMYDGRHKYFYIYFDDTGNETRVQVLRRHDLILREVHFVIKQLAPGPVVAFYTGRLNVEDVGDVLRLKSSKSYQYSHNLYPILHEAGHQGLYSRKFNSDTTLYSFDGVFIESEGQHRHVPASPNSIRSSWIKDKEIINNLKYDTFTLQFHFNIDEDSWHLDEISVLEMKKKVVTKLSNVRNQYYVTETIETPVVIGVLPTPHIQANWGRSYACPYALTITSNDGKSVTISRYQIEPFIKALEYPNILRAGSKFSSSISCESHAFVTDTILSGLFVVSMLFAILFYGIVSMMAVKTNDLYDDPAGKRLTFGEEAL